MDWTQIVLAVLVVAAAAALVFWREKAKVGFTQGGSFVKDVVEETKKITWPGREELKRATMVIIAFVIVVAVIIGLMDVILQFLLVRLPGRVG